MTGNQPDELDRILDAALAGYSNEEPRPGLEQRVLRRIHAAGPARGFGWWRSAVAIPAFAALLLVATYVRTRHPAQADVFALQPGRTPLPSLTIHPDNPRPDATAVQRQRRRVVHRPPLAAAALPKRGVFPAPAPLTDEERALVNLVTRFPEQAREVLVVADQQSREPITVPKIEIPPLPGGSER